MKKQLSILMVTIFLFNALLQTGIMAAVEDASSWAQMEVSTAIEEGLVHSNLQGEYQENIKRYEYVLLALEVLDQENVNVSIVRQYPFTDILEHTYKEEIVRAYNAGIIKGYGDGTFRPDAAIRREEIASLVVNLVKVLEDDEVNIQEQSIQYADNSSISGWAKPYIDYCYTNDIMKGIGKNNNGLDIISPQGKATREQSIVLLYRLAKENELLRDEVFEPVKVLTGYDEETDEAIYESSTLFNDFSKEFDDEITTMIYNELIDSNNVIIEELDTHHISLNMYGNSSLNLSSFDTFQSIRVIYEKGEDSSALDHFLTITLMMKDNPNVSYEIMQEQTKLEDEGGSFYRELNAFESIFGSTYEEDGVDYIEFRYEYRLK